MQKLIIHLPRYSVELTGDHETEVIRKAAFWLSLPLECPHCGTALILNYRTPKNYQYYELRCTGSEQIHSVNLGQSQNEARDLYFDNKKPWYTVPASQYSADRNAINPDATPTSALSDRATPVAASSEAKVPDPTSAARNELTKLIRECKAIGIDSKLNQADVSALDTDQLASQIQRLGSLLLNAAGRQK